METDFSYIKRNLAAVLGERDALASRLGYAPATLVAVTKSGTDGELVALVRAGASDIGENRPQELVRRAALLASEGLFPRMHEIGNLQTNKVRSVLPVAALIHSVGSFTLASEIERRCAALDRKADVLIEINSGEEEAKGGVMPDDALRFYEQIRPLSHLRILGLMTMGPAVSEEEIRPCFRKTKTLFDRIGETYGYDTDRPVLSMGMSDSYRVAIEEGSTLIRVGRRLFIK